ncbi:MAG: hypothetical protein ACOY46_08775 [Bacillota bacterium]
MVKGKEKLCRRCSRPVKKFSDGYDVFEQMHWLCFHLEFEHGNYEPDEPCDDPSCPWNRIQGIKRIGILDPIWDVIIYSENKRSVVRLRFLEKESERYPSIKVAVEIEDNGVQVEISTWIEREAWGQFLEDFERLEKIRKGSAILESMSPGECIFHYENYDTAGHIFLKYAIKKSTTEPWRNFCMSGGFALDSSEIIMIQKAYVKLFAKVE